LAGAAVVLDGVAVVLVGAALVLAEAAVVLAEASVVLGGAPNDGKANAIQATAQTIDSVISETFIWSLQGIPELL
jgi:hypothetical protein